MQPFKNSFIGVALVPLAVATYVVLAGREPARLATRLRDPRRLLDIFVAGEFFEDKVGDIGAGDAAGGEIGANVVGPGGRIIR